MLVNNRGGVCDYSNAIFQGICYYGEASIKFPSLFPGKFAAGKRRLYNGNWTRFHPAIQYTICYP